MWGAVLGWAEPLITIPPMAKPRLAVLGITTSLLVLVGLSVLACWPILMHGAPDLSWDGLVHAVWAKQFASQFWHGDWYPRWFTDINAGYGGSSGFFYPPVTNYAASIFWPLVASRDTAGFLSSGYSLILAFTLSGITALLWLRSFTEPRAALMGAVVYLIAPYHLTVDLYLRGASAELWVFVWLPLVMLSAEGLLRHARWAVPAAAISYSLAVLSHPSTALCFAPIAVAYVIFLSEGKERVRLTSIFVAALLLGVGLDAIYLLPALLDRHKASFALYTAGAVDYQRNWLLPWRDEFNSGVHYLRDRFAGRPASMPPGVPGYFLMLLITLSALGAITLLFLLIRRYETSGRIQRIAGFYAIVALVSFFLMTKPSAFIWRLAGFLKFLQVPFRLNVMLALCLAVLVALAASYLARPRARAISLFLTLLTVAWLAVDAWAPSHVYSAWTPNPAKSNWHALHWQMEASDLMPWPAAERIPIDPAEFDRFVEAHPPKAVRIESPLTNEPTGTAVVESWQLRRVQIKVHSSQDSQLTVNYFYYEGWQGRIKGAEGTLSASPSPEGFIQMKIPRGDYELILELPYDQAERVGSLISLLSAMLLAAIIGSAWLWGRTQPEPKARATVITVQGTG